MKNNWSEVDTPFIEIGMNRWRPDSGLEGEGGGLMVNQDHVAWEKEILGYLPKSSILSIAFNLWSSRRWV